MAAVIGVVIAVVIAVVIGVVIAAVIAVRRRAALGPRNAVIAASIAVRSADMWLRR